MCVLIYYALTINTFSLAMFNVLNCTDTHSFFRRCACGECIIMPTVNECRCCAEYAQYRHKIEELPANDRVLCITLHPGFQVVCLNNWVLQAAYYSDRQRYGNIQANQQE